ncbi:TetM/TetW/TetO/TetS family tetracycline resistance ribosomal protection protein [Bifidobacterium sp. H1HS16N]|uniref:TetM/TetW/TetO/TetS family tetracycline resistance ribosomal protection protein n=1 Tax=Bifidobacterium kimbladii TaxID=1293826 RepID=A0ABU3KDL0_9BIFI|nr:TetM/TetW/TetO/TetS family tetracycline resistance ribosomal protection protein [Bifidobacterium sp. H1HS16N]MDT7508768.1 TetM/TetW/TetO/TetS family tetracycline resistance ribosomal protection protein [Bifidobacterium sp. H1HS16N]
MVKRIVAGMLAHVDAGKTTLSEAMLYRGGEIRRPGRVDHGDAYLDTNDLERQRGITIFSKPARLAYRDVELTLIDTPGHVDFSAEMERVLSVLDYALLVVDATAGLEGYVDTLWRLLAGYEVPTFIFVNKLDAPGADAVRILQSCKQRWSPGCFDLSRGLEHGDMEDVALLDEDVMDEYLKTEGISDESLARLVAERRLFPCFLGSALRLDGVDALMEGLERYTFSPGYGREFGARVFKVSHDDKGARLTWLKVTGGDLPVKSSVITDLCNGSEGQSGSGKTGYRQISETIDQLRLYSGAAYRLTDCAQAGSVVAATGLDLTHPGQGLGCERKDLEPVLEPVLTYAVTAEGLDPHQVLKALRILEDEDPLLHVVWQEQLQEIHLRLMGQVQLEVIQEELERRFGMQVSFSQGGILYRETIATPVEGVGHFEPLRHYAEVHLLLEPTGPGSGLSFASTCSLDRLDGNWQRLIMTHLAEKEHLGVLTGSPITDMRITLLDGRGHIKHTEGGDFRQATYRAVRQGLMKASSILLEPWYHFRLTIPQANLGRAMSDIYRMKGNFAEPQADGDTVELEGDAPVSQMRDYAIEVSTYSHGRGHLVCFFSGYRPCQDQDALVDSIGYDPESDLENTPDSVFCAHGAGYPVKWNKVEDFMHLPGGRYI